MTRTDWRRAAVYAQVDPELFYPVDETPRSPAIAAALRVCAGCPVRAVCLADALASEDPARRWGVIGGTTPAQRTLLFAAARPSGADGGAVAA
ncbi:WhiB family transcriptional regulator [Pseudonocardia bannensis]|uniref:WhiB family transcriptional regulator n=1 Tax=Pseudonocardia bannensis TaxID=630973 RepID=A0A848DCZ6_9PSEU|nr:WhiB family transcriptional regulator [Pseudonocardia bannensis]NMH90464.1 WhiB family transcriptional regulator [Pseudonocardia bannensis]